MCFQLVVTHRSAFKWHGLKHRGPYAHCHPKCWLQNKPAHYILYTPSWPCHMSFFLLCWADALHVAYCAMQVNHIKQGCPPFPTHVITRDFLGRRLSRCWGSYQKPHIGSATSALQGDYRWLTIPGLQSSLVSCYRSVDKLTRPISGPSL